MARHDPPPAGWYPDPSGGVRLRWWDGTDWTDRYRARPNISAAERTEAANVRLRARGLPVPETLQDARRMAGAIDTDALVAQVRQATRAEIDRAADVFSARARAATRDIQPLVSQYTNRFLRLLRLALVLVVVVVVVWIVLQIAANAAFFDWLGDRIDDLTDNRGS